MAPGRVTDDDDRDGEGANYGHNTVEALVKEKRSTNVTNLSATESQVLQTIRILVADLCQQFSGGHPGYSSQDCELTRFIG